MKTLLALPCRLILPALCSAFLALSPLTGHAQSSGIISVDIASPTNGAFYFAPTNIDLIAGVTVSNDAVISVEFFDNSNSIGVSTNFSVVDPPGSPGLPPGSLAFSLDWTNDRPGLHYLTATATDARSNTLTSEAVVIQIATNQTTPTVVITEPPNGAQFVALTNVLFDVSVDDPTGETAYVLFVATPSGSGVLPDFALFLGSVSNFISVVPPTRNYMFDWSNAIPGTWTINAAAYRTNGANIGSANVQITVATTNVSSPPFSVDIASPTNGASFPGPTNIELIAGVVVSNDTVESVEFFDGSNIIGFATNWIEVDPPGSPGLPAGSHAFTLDWTNDTSGIHSLTAVATDTAGITVTSAPTEITIGNATPPPPPVVQITEPISGSVFTTPVNIQIDASVDEPARDVAYVSFAALETFSNNNVIVTVSLGNVTNFIYEPPYQLYSVIWSNAMPGQWSIVATAVRSNGTTAVSAPVRITVEKGPPYSLLVNITQPTNSMFYPGPTNIGLIAETVTSNDTVASVTFYNGPYEIGVVTNWVEVDPIGSPGPPVEGRAYFLTWTNDLPGIHILTAVATDVNGNTVTSPPVVITIGNATPPPPPTPVVRITSPASNAMFRAPVNVSLLAYASEPNGAVGSVEFFAGSNALGFGQPVRSPFPLPIAGPLTPEDSPENVPVRFVTNTYEWIWSNAPVGAFAITAVATDTNGNTATSAPVNITILPPIIPPTNHPAIVNIVATDPIAVEGTNCWRWLGGPPTWSNWMSPTAIWTWYTNCGPKEATFTVNRYGNTNSDLTVNYAIGGTASNGVDYAMLPGSVMLPAGQSAATITIVPIDATTSIVTKTIVLTLQPTTNVPVDYLLGLPRSAEGLIIDSERAQPLGALLPDGSFHMCLTGPDGAWFHIDYSTDLIHWTTLCTNQVIEGSIDFIDPDAAIYPTRDYRAVPIATAPSP